MKKEFTKIKKILEEHLATINDNTSEIQSLFDYLQELEIKIDKFSQRIDQLQLSQELPLSKPNISPLDHTERKIFLVFYTEDSPLSYKEVSIKADIPFSLVPDCVSSLISKGIPFQRSTFNNQLFLKLNPGFKELQAKENIINLSLQSFIE
ncbi:MAG: hypothetical protein ABH824_03770 [Nanoarchaeota archaeon]|nr:hypothetical protein [Nanoarchaeota archaeon]MBU1631862.1 hypothetical protein [Nanoarchaeota archaeon]MBU1875855.1 hypothetical protein [Nanoarchaeota archaeon]